MSASARQILEIRICGFSFFLFENNINLFKKSNKKKELSKMIEILNLPDELISKIFKNLKAVELNSVILTCKRFREIAQDDLVWKWFCWKGKKMFILKFLAGIFFNLFTDYRANENHLWDGWSFREFYTKGTFSLFL